MSAQGNTRRDDLELLDIGAQQPESIPLDEFDAAFPRWEPTDEELNAMQREDEARNDAASESTAARIAKANISIMDSFTAMLG